MWIEPRIKVATRPLVRSLCSLVLLACGCDTEAPSERKITVTEWDTVWVTTRAMMDSLIPAPGLLTYNDGALFVVERSTPRVVALDAESGTFLWKAGRMGAGPEEFAGIAAAYPDRDGGLAVVDIRNRRISRLSPRGEFVSRIGTGNLGQQPTQVCRLGENRLIVADVFRSRLIESDSSGAPIGSHQLLWADLESTDWQSRQVTIRGNGEATRCLVALSTGRGFALLSPDSGPIVVPYIESFEPYQIGSRADEGEMTHWATYQAAILNDTVSILFSGQTPEKDRLIDRYDAPSGRYLETLLLPHETSRFTAGDRMLYVLDTSKTQIVALRPHR